MEYLNDVVEFKVKIHKDYALVEFELKRELKPEDLREIKPPDPVKNGFSSKIVILSGRGPIWFYGFLVHFYHPTKAIGVFDPRIDGAVVVATHMPELKIGNVIKREKWEVEI